MTLTKLATALTVTFVITAVVIVAELLFLLLRRHRRRRSSHLRPTPPPISGENQQPNHPLKQSFHFQFHFSCFKSQTRIEPSAPPTETPDGIPPDDPVIDVFKLLESNGRSGFLCTIKEDESEYVESEKMSLRECFVAEATAEEKAEPPVEVESTTVTVLSSPVFFTPIGSPVSDGFDVTVAGKG